MNREGIIEVLNNLLSYVLLYILVGVIHILIIEHKSIIQFFKQQKKSMKYLLPSLKRSRYLLLGVFILFSSFVIVNSIIEILIPTALEINLISAESGEMKSFMVDQIQYTGLFAVVGFALSGISLILSGGGRWLVNLSKLLITVSILYLVFAVIVAYS